MTVGNWTRRDLLRAGAFVPFLSMNRLRAEPRALRIGILGEPPEDAKRGIELGAREAARTAQLLGRTLAVVSEPSNATAIVSAQSSISPIKDTVVVSIGGGVASPPCVFSVATPATNSVALLERWTSEHGTKPDLHVAEWHPTLARFGASELNERYAAAFRAPMTAAAWRGWFAIKAIVDSALAVEALTCAAFAAARFDGHKGRPLAFDKNGLLKQPLYVISGDRVIGDIT